MAVVIMLCPLSPRSIMDQVIHVWFKDFGFSHVGLVTTSAFGSIHTATECCCVVDMGWSATQVVPTYKYKILGPIRRQPLGGRHLVGLWKYYCSYRQWNLMDAEFLLEEVHRALSYVSLDLRGELDNAQHNILGKRHFDREYVLPDYQTVLKGFVRLTPWLKKLDDKKLRQERELCNFEQASPDPTGKGRFQRDKTEKTIEKNARGGISKDESGNEDESEDFDSDEETDNQQRKRLLYLKEEEDQRKREIEAERQTLMVSVERFTIPEVIFYPSDAGLETKMASLPQVIVSAIKACPSIYQSALYESIRLIGGACQLSNVKDRLCIELRRLIPSQYDLKIEVASDPVNDAWIKASSWLQHNPFSQWSLSRENYEACLRPRERPRVCQKMLEKQHGRLI
eukprot:CAMPEP_0194187070 /NCGR_PEP_ID=MMETSP0154-20130528/49406_1 /TAXON_ID=1049557 /ORGANISM="Thalassiothrix antarctica, Strain L6-D1" /LENGTH=397 /DNA_ID=CAMNT_0038906545 /DNA_START=361 /DNA_END=1554 /DNA_ORIENTATION=-